MSAMSGRAVVFLGPTLTRAAAAAALPEAVIRPPARQGDVLRAVRDGAAAIGLIDGVFLDVPAVWHRELLFALARGVPVLGAASMGALRATELAPFGMVPVGRIARAYIDGAFPPFPDAFEDDDEVAVVHAPEAAGYAALSDAMVDLRAALGDAWDAGMIDIAERDALCAAMKRLHFPQRSFAALDAAATALLPPDRAAALRAHAAAAPRAKRDDARALLRALAEGAAPPAPSFRMERALVWEAVLARADADPVTEAEAAVLDELGLDPEGWRAAATAASGRLAPPGAARTAKATPDVLNRFRRARGLLTRAALDAWLDRNGMDGAALTRLLGRQRAAEAAAEAAAPDTLRRAVLDLLRLDGRFPVLLARARARLAAGTAPPNRAAADAALDWYFAEHLGTTPPASVAAHAAACGFTDAAAFRAAVWGACRRAHDDDKSQRAGQDRTSIDA